MERIRSSVIQERVRENMLTRFIVTPASKVKNDEKTSLNSSAEINLCAPSIPTVREPGKFSFLQ